MKSHGIEMKTLVRAYEGAPWLQKALVSLRPMICPFEPIIDAVPPNQNVLDVGSGVGAILILLALRGDLSSGVGCDLNPASVAVARKAAVTVAHPKLDFMTNQSIDDMPSGPFDVVTVIDVMHHVPARLQSRFFAACAERVKPGGTLVYKDMANRPLWKNLANRLHDALLAQQYIHYAPLLDVKQWASHLGLTIQEERAYSRLAYAHELVVFNRNGS